MVSHAINVIKNINCESAIQIIFMSLVVNTRPVQLINCTALERFKSLMRLNSAHPLSLIIIFGFTSQQLIIIVHLNSAVSVSSCLKNRL